MAAGTGKGTGSRALRPNRQVAREGNRNCFVCRYLYVLPFRRCSVCTLIGAHKCTTIQAVLLFALVTAAGGVVAAVAGGEVSRTVFLMTALAVAVLLLLNAYSNEKARTSALLAERHREMAEQHEFLRALSPIDSLPECLDYIISSASERLRCRRVSIMLADEHGDYLSIAASCGVPEDVVRTTRIPIGRRVAGKVILHGNTVHVRDAGLKEGDSALPIDAIAFMSGPLLLAGMRWGKDRLGVLSVTEPIGREDFSAEDEFVFSNIREASAVAIHNHLAVAKVRQGNVEFLETLVNAIEARDKYTRGHSERVSHYAAAIGRRLMLGPEMLSQLQVAGRLHDIGKIGMTDAILLKAGALTEEEWEAIRRHTDIGAEMLANASPVSSALDAIRGHHERLDGSGYPHGLRGADICLPARILGVADAFDAMTTKRPYHEAMSVSSALVELKCQRGRKFDAGCVDALIETVNAGELGEPVNLAPASAAG